MNNKNDSISTIPVAELNNVTGGSDQEQPPAWAKEWMKAMCQGIATEHNFQALAQSRTCMKTIPE